MTAPDYTADWREYWERRHDSGRRMELERAARDPVGRWVTADVRELDDEEVGIDPATLYDHPDEVLAAARDGFEAFVDAADLGVPEVPSYDLLPVHVVGVGGATGLDRSLVDPVEDANAVTVIETGRVLSGPRREPRPAVVTYRCPAGHETTVEASPYRQWAIETCGRPECTNAVRPVDTATKVRRVAEFDVDLDGRELSCVLTGRYAAAGDVYDRIAGADRLSLTGIARLVVSGSTGIDPVYELLHAEPV